MAIEIIVTNETEQGKWVDIFRGIPPVSYEGIKIETGNIDIPAEGDSIVDGETDIELTYQDLVKAISAHPHDIGDIIIESSFKIKEIDSLVNGLKIVTYDANGTALVHKFCFDVDLYQWSEYASHISLEKNEFRLAGNVFVRVYSPSNSKMRLSFYAPHKKPSLSELNRIGVTNEPLNT